MPRPSLLRDAALSKERSKKRSTLPHNSWKSRSAAVLSSVSGLVGLFCKHFHPVKAPGRPPPARSRPGQSASRRAQASLSPSFHWRQRSMGLALWLFVLTVNLAPQTHVPKLASLPHASPTNVTFMSSFSQGHPPSRLSFSPLGSLSKPSADGGSPTHTLIHLPRHHLLTYSNPPKCTHTHLVLQPSASTCLFRWYSLNLFHILPGSYFWLLCSQCLHYQEYISCQFIRGLNTARDSLVGKFELLLKRLLIPPKVGPLNALWWLFPCGSELTKITVSCSKFTYKDHRQRISYFNWW